MANRVFSASTSRTALLAETTGTPLTFAVSTTAVFGRNLFASNETFNLAAGTRLEVNGLLWMTGAATAQGVWIGDAIKAVYNVREAAGTDFTLGRYSAGDSSLGLTRTASPMVGLNRIGLVAVPYAEGTQALATIEGTPLAGASSFGSTANLINTTAVRVYILADDVTKCKMFARLF